MVFIFLLLLANYKITQNSRYLGIIYENIMIEKNIPCIKLHTYDSIDSTSSQLKRMIESDESIDNYTTVIASHQSGGRGQGSNRWSSNAGENLTFSFL